LELDEAEPGYRHVLFQPRPGGSLTSAKAELVTPFGKSGISWKLNGANLEVELLVPEGAHATFSTPPGFNPPARTAFEAGCHRFHLTA
jgi:alpha-L-rhamnosidase